MESTNLNNKALYQTVIKIAKLSQEYIRYKQLQKVNQLLEYLNDMIKFN